MDEPPRISHAEKTSIVHSYLSSTIAPHEINGWYMWLREALWRTLEEIRKGNL